MGKELSDRLKVKRGFEMVMGKTHDKLMEIGKHSQQRALNKKNGEIIGYSIYNPQDKTRKFVYTPKYRLIRFINQTRSRIKNYFSKN